MTEIRTRDLWHTSPEGYQSANSAQLRKLPLLIWQEATLDLVGSNQS
jgi:hypothetical protein